MKGWRSTLAGLIALAGLLSACSPGPSPAPSPQPSASLSRSADHSGEVGSCAGEVTLIASTGQTETITRGRSPQFAVRVGDTLRIEATGRCGDRVRLAPGSGLDPMSSGQRSTTAVKAGTSRLGVYHAMCDELPDPEGCMGGIADDGAARIVIGF